jgi:hypothetical protein
MLSAYFNPIAIRFIPCAVFLVFFPFARSLAQNNVQAETKAAKHEITVKSAGGTATENITGLLIQGTLILKKDFINQTPVDDLGPGTIEFSGTTVQNFTGQNTIGTMIINNTAGLDINGNTSVNTDLSLLNGHIRLGSHNLVLGDTAMVSGSPSSASMVIATGTGELRKSFQGASGFTYPVGDNSGLSEYTPVTLDFTGGSFSTGNYAGVKLTNAAYPGSTGNYLNRYWNISQDGISNPVYNAVFQYVPADIIGNESGISCVKVDPAPAVQYNPANTLLHQLSANGLTTIATFTGAQLSADKLLTLNFFLEGLYAGGSLMNKAQNGLGGNQYAGNVADKVSIELHQGTNYTSIAYTDNNVDLSVNGTASLNVPVVHNGSYFITIKHRNSVAVTTSAPVAFSGSSISYSFNQPSKAYGDNLKLMSDGQYAIFTGDSNQDGAVDGPDMIDIDNDVTVFATGYLPTDLNGDGAIDAIDLITADNNATFFVAAILP